MYRAKLPRNYKGEGRNLPKYKETTVNPYGFDIDATNKLLKEYYENTRYQSTAFVYLDSNSIIALSTTLRNTSGDT